MALSSGPGGDQELLQTLRDHYFKALNADGTEKDAWPSDAGGPVESSDALITNGYKAKIGSLSQAQQDDLNTLMNKMREYGDSTP